MTSLSSLPIVILPFLNAQKVNKDAEAAHCVELVKRIKTKFNANFYNEISALHMFYIINLAVYDIFVAHKAQIKVTRATTRNNGCTMRNGS